MDEKSRILAPTLRTPYEKRSTNDAIFSAFLVVVALRRAPFFGGAR